MRIFVAGASGAIGSRLVPELVKRGHEVYGTTRSPDKAELVRSRGAEPVVLDVLDREAVREAVQAVRPDAIVHQATALTGTSDLKHFDRTSGRRTDCAPRARTRCWPPPGRTTSAGSSPRASPAGRTLEWVARSRPRRTRSTRLPPSR